MTIASALENLNTDIINARTAITTKGGTVTANGGSSQLATDIATIPTGGGSATLITKSITANGTYNASSDNADGYSSVNVNVPTGITPTGTRTITANGTYDVTNYASADVNVSGGNFVGIPREINNGVFSLPTISDFNLPNTVTTIGERALAHAFEFQSYETTKGVTSVDFSSVEAIENYGMAQFAKNCGKIKNVNLENLETTGEGALSDAFSMYTFQSNTFTIDLSSLQTVGSSCFSGAFYRARITTIDLSKVTTIGDYGFANAFYDSNLHYGDFTGVTSLQNKQCFSKSSSMSVSSNSLPSIAPYGAFAGAPYSGPQKMKIDFSSLVSVSGDYCFAGAFRESRINKIGVSQDEGVDFSNLEEVTGHGCFYCAFSGRPISEVSFPKLTIIGSSTASGANGSHFASAFTDTTSTERVLRFPMLKEIYCTGGSSLGTFYNCKQPTAYYFPKLNTITYATGASASNQSACKYIFSGNSNVTELHFGASNQTAIEATDGYSTLWGRGAGNATVYFDL